MVVITIGWVSFLAAGVAEMLFFATFDPGALLQAATFPFPLSHSAVYTIGFVLFWLLGAATAAATTWLLAATPHRSPLADRFDDDAGDSR
jgi:hypothetical protein